MLVEAFLCLALNIFHESQDQGYDGMAAVAQVTMTRAKGKEENVCREVFRKKAFSWANPLTTVSKRERARRAPKFLPNTKNPIERNAWMAAKVVARQALNGELDSYITATIGKSDHYFNPDKADPYWKDSMKKIAVIGDHVFYDSREKG